MQHDYVVVPNLGGFVIQMQSALFLSDRIIPPHATIGFNPLMNQSDGLLAIEISRSEQISYRKAVEYLDNEVENLKSRLNTSENIVIGKLGILHRNNTGSLTFNPIYNANFLPQNFGLSDLYISKRASKSTDEQRKVTINLPSTRIYKYVAAAMLVFGLFFFSPRVDDLKYSNSAGLITIPIANNIEKNDSLKKTQKNNTKDSITSINILTNNQFHVIVASLADKKSAEKFCKELISEKYTNAHILSPIRNYRVAIQSFPTKDKAYQFMENLRKSDNRFKTAWVFGD